MKSPRFYDHNGSTDKEEHSSNDENEDEDEDEIYLNTHEPFCMVTVGVQGAGKSHTTAAALEGCLIQHDILSDVIKLRKPMTALVLHYNSNPTTNCEVRTHIWLCISPCINDSIQLLKKSSSLTHDILFLELHLPFFLFFFFSFFLNLFFSEPLPFFPLHFKN